MENLEKMLNIYKNKKVFITGHTGFKGTWLSSMLDLLGAHQVGFSLAPNTKPSHFELLNSTNLSVTGDIIDQELLKKSVQNFKPDILFHLAAQPLVRESYNNPTYTFQTNVMGTMNVLEVVKQCPSIKAVIIITTDKVYENKEWLFPYRENDELGGYDIYSSSKAATEILTRSYQRSFFNLEKYQINHNTLIATVRAGNVIGGGDWNIDRLIPDLVKNANISKSTKIRNPQAIRPWQHVLDCLNGYLLLGSRLLNEEPEFADSWNFSPFSFESKTVKEIAMIGQKIWPNIFFDIEPNDDYHEAGILKLDNSKAFSKLHWQPKWNTENAIIKTIEWYKTYYQNNKVLTHNQIKEFLSI
jgi:CDP-glucose 4,6-dehydratase